MIKFFLLLFVFSLSRMGQCAIHDAVVMKNGTTVYGQIISIDSLTTGVTIVIDANITNEKGIRVERRNIRVNELTMIRVGGKTYPDYAVPVGYRTALAPAAPPQPQPVLQQTQPAEPPALPPAAAIQEPVSPQKPEPVSNLETSESQTRKKGIKEVPVKTEVKEILHPEFLRKEPSSAMLSGLILPGGGALYNEKTGMCIVHSIFQIGVPAIVLAIPAKGSSNDIKIGIAVSFFAVSKIWDMYKGILDAQAFNHQLSGKK